MCLTQSTWKVRSDEMAKLKVLSRQRRTVLCLSRSQVSERSKSLGCWRASRFLSKLSYRLSSFCWAVNRFPYIWTHSGVFLYFPSPRPPSMWVACAKEVCKQCVNPYILIVNPLRTDRHASTTSDLHPTSARLPCTITSLTLRCLVIYTKLTSIDEL